MAKSDIVPADEQETPEYDDHDWTRVDRQIIDAFGKKSIRQLSEETGVSQADLMRRKQELVDSVDVLTIQMQRMKLMATLQEIADKALERANSSVDEFKAGLFNSSVAAVKELLKQLDRLESKGSGDVVTLNNLRVRELLALVDRVVSLSVEQISEEHEIDADDLMAVFKANLIPAAAEMDNS